MEIPNEVIIPSPLPTMLDINRLGEIQEAHARATAVAGVFIRTTMELLAARALGRDMDALFSELEVLLAVRAREEAALREVLEAAKSEPSVTQ